MKLARHMGYEVEERRLAISDVLADAHSGKLTEAFGTGTAAVVSPVNLIAYQGDRVSVGDGSIGKITQQLYDMLTGIQTGKVADPFGWITHI